MTIDEQAQFENLRHKVDLLQRELEEAQHALTVIEQQHFREKVEALEKAGDDLEKAAIMFKVAVRDPLVNPQPQLDELDRATSIWQATRRLPVISDPETTPVPA